jgi:aldehyde dehydrogenase (NAD+)
MAGNAVVFKPASLTPRTGKCFVDAFVDAGLPKGILNMVTGGGGVVGEEMTTNQKIKAISFTGSTPVGRGIHEKAATILAKTQLEMGGKNPIVVMDDCDLDEAVNATFVAAYACAGQWCTSTSRAIVCEGVYEEFIKKLADKVAEKKVGFGTDFSTAMGPVCGKKQLEDILYFINKGIEEGARLVCGGKRITDGGLENGCFIEPTVFADVTSDMTIAKEEIFGPVLSVMKVKDFDEAIAVANDTVFGLSSSIYTKSLSYAMRFLNETEVGLTHVNVPTAHKEPQLSFGGIKHSGAGLPESGRTGVEFFTRHKVVYIKY